MIDLRGMNNTNDYRTREENPLAVSFFRNIECWAINAIDNDNIGLEMRGSPQRQRALGFLGESLDVPTNVDNKYVAALPPHQCTYLNILY
jgi:hypothetical protein